MLADVDGDAAESASAALRQEGFDAAGVGCDVACEKDVAAMVDAAVGRFGRLDFAYNNAGIQTPHAKVADIETVDFDRVLAVNLRGVWLCMKYELRQMTGRGGAIANCSSQGGLVGIPTIGAYTASKHGVIGLTKAAALEYAPEGITINVVCPGTCDTPMVAGAAADSPEHMRTIIDAIPAGRMGRSEEVAATVLWLCSPEASFVVGQAIPVDGGYTAQ